MKGLVIAEPWIGLILSGGKTWELRSRRTQHRGPFALIRKGSGTVVGVADLSDCLPPLTASTMADTEACHGVPPCVQPSAVGSGWVVPWLLKSVQAIRPVPHLHPPGAVTWVLLDQLTSGHVFEQVRMCADT